MANSGAVIPQEPIARCSLDDRSFGGEIIDGALKNSNPKIVLTVRDVHGGRI
jgi:hypothetical protein